MQRFNYTFLLVFISVVLVLSMFSLVMDPYVLFDSQRINDINRYKPAGLRHIRLSKAYRVTGEQFDTLILGSSRTGRGLQCSMIASAGASCYNASTTAATPLESLRYLQQQRPATVYLGLDLFTVLDQRLLNERFVDDRLRLGPDGGVNYRFDKQWITDHLGSLASSQAVDDSYVTLRKQDKAALLPAADGMPVIHSDGSWGEDPARLAARGGDVRGKKQEKRFVHIYGVMMVLFQKSHDQHLKSGTPVAETVDQHLDAFREIVEYCHANNIRLKVFFNTAHAYYWQLVYRTVGRELVEHWKRRVLEINHSVAYAHQADSFTIFDFSGINAVSVEEMPSAENGYRLMENFQDVMHYSTRSGADMSKIMSADCGDAGDESWGNCLGPDNIESWLESQWLAYQEFSSDNETELADFTKRARAALRKRKASATAW